MSDKRHTSVAQVSKPAGRSGFVSNGARGSAPKAPARAGFTLVEILTVIAIIGILAAMLLVVIHRAIASAKKTQARTDIANLENAIAGYEQAYGRPPVPTAVQQSGLASVTYGGTYVNGAGTQWPPSPAPSNFVQSNSDIIAILMDVTNFPGGGPTANANHVKNSQERDFLGAKMCSDTSSPGVGTDLNFRDPWGNPYIITINLNDDNKTEDLFYGAPAVSSSTGSPGGPGLNGLMLQPDGNYAFHGNVMVWSMGPDGPFNHAPSSFNANALATGGENKQHILSWQ